MTQKHHLRTVEIHTCTLSCDRCSERSDTCGVETLVGRGWRLGRYLPDGAYVPDLCPGCAGEERDREHRQAESAARDRSIVALEAGEPPLVHGRILSEAT